MIYLSSKKMRHFFEGLAMASVLRLYGLLPLEQASFLGGWLFEKIGPYLPVSSVARKNLSHVFQEKSAAEIEKFVKGMWNNLGRVGAEYVHTKSFLNPASAYIELKGEDILDMLKTDSKPALLFTGHLSNWQMSSIIAKKNNLHLFQVYRKANNPFVEKLIQKYQRLSCADLITKGTAGSKKLLSALRQGEHVLILMDQKFNEGISVPFFGKEAMTASAIARLAKKFQCPLVPVQVERKPHAHFRVTFHPPLCTQGTEYDILKQVNAHLEQWILETPDQWLWLHNRWPKT